MGCMQVGRVQGVGRGWRWVVRFRSGIKYVQIGALVGAGRKTHVVGVA